MLLCVSKAHSLVSRSRITGPTQFPSMNCIQA
jgi:hypothetical protein